MAIRFQENKSMGISFLQEILLRNGTIFLAVSRKRLIFAAKYNKQQ